MATISRTEAAQLIEFVTSRLEYLTADELAEYEDILSEYERETHVSALKSDLYQFMREAWPIVCEDDFVDGWHLRLMCRYLEAMFYGELFTDLVINIPPGCCKSLLTAVIFPAWVWAKNPAMKIIHITYDIGLTIRDAERSRDLITSDWYRNLFPDVQIKKDSNAKSEYKTTAGGYRLSTTPGGRVTGEHPNFILCDDPINASNSERENVREKVNEWWSKSISTRGATKRCRRLITMQRLHDLDLVGYVLFNPENPLSAQGWAHLCLPMEYEPDRMADIGLGTDPRTTEGELLWEGLYPRSLVDKLKVELGSDFSISAQFQQKPQAKKGNFFKIERIQMIDEDVLPEMRRVIRAWDKAGTEDGGCYTAGVLMGMDAEKRLYILDVVRQRLGTDGVESLIQTYASIDQARWGYGRYSIVVEREPGASGKQAMAETSRNLAGYRLQEMAHQANKVLRAGTLAKKIYAFNVYIVRAVWSQKLISEMTAFPKGSFKDQVDSAAMACLSLTVPQYMLPEDLVSDETKDGLSHLHRCNNPKCCRPATEENSYCCDGCRCCHQAGREIEPHGVFAHSSVCNLENHKAKAKGW